MPEHNGVPFQVLPGENGPLFYVAGNILACGAHRYLPITLYRVRGTDTFPLHFPECIKYRAPILSEYAIPNTGQPYFPKKLYRKRRIPRSDTGNQLHLSGEKRVATKQLSEDATDAPQVYRVSVQPVGTEHQLGGAVPPRHHVFGHRVVDLSKKIAETESRELELTKFDGNRPKF